LALGITNKDLEEIPIGSLKVESEKTSTNNGNICEEGNIFYNNKCITYDEHCHIYYGEYSYSTKHDNFGNNTCDCKVGYKWFYEIETPTNYCVENKVVRNDLKGSEKGLVKNYTFTYDWAGINISRYWNDKNQSEEINISIEVPQELYDQYVYQKTHIFANDFSNLSDFVTYNDEVIKNVANQIDQLYQNTGMNPVLIAQLLVDEIVYTDDINAGYNEYPKYPVETLVDGKGDCEDTSFLLSALLRASKLSFQSALIEFENHIGIAIIVLNDTYNDYIDDGMVDYIKANTYLDDAKMLYVETTGQKWKVGTMPTSLIDQKQTIHLIE